MNFLKYWLPPLLWASFIIYLSSLPVKPSEGGNFYLFMSVKKIIHLFEYGILWLLLYRAEVASFNVTKKRASILATIAIVVWGTIDEYHQGLVPGSGGQPHIHDVFIDLLGGLASLAFIWNILPKAPKTLKSWAESLEVI